MPIPKLILANGGSSIGDMGGTINLIIDAVEIQNVTIPNTITIPTPNSIFITSGMVNGEVLFMANSTTGEIGSKVITVNFTDIIGSINPTTQIQDGTIPLTKLIGGGLTGWNSLNDGSGSGLDADLLDGHQGTYYATQTSLDLKLDISSYTANDVSIKLKTVDGAGSGIDADMLDGKHGSEYGTVKSVQGNTPDPLTGAVTGLANGTNGVANDSAKLGGITSSGYAVKSQTTQFTGQLRWGNSGERVETKSDAGQIASKSGFFETSNPVNYYPGATSAQHLIDCRYNVPNLNYAMQIAGSFFDHEFWGRKTKNNGAAPWVKFWTSGNLNPIQKSTYVQNHVTPAKVFVPAVDTHLDLLDTAIVAAAGDAVKITATISLETTHDKVFYLMRNGVETGSAQVGAYSGLIPMPHDADISTTISNVNFCFVDTAPVSGLNTYSVHMRGTSSAIWLNQTAIGASGATFQQERATSTIILEKI